MERSKILKKFPFLKNRSDKSIEKSADSFMDLSNKIWATIFVSFIALPLTGLIKIMLGEETTLPTLEYLHQFVEVNLGVFISILIFGAVLAIKFRKSALDLYDVLEG